jgi:N-acetylglucosamine-6-phosphate deacetylase
MAEVSLTDAIRMITGTPARILGVSGKKGSLVVGKDADIIIFDKNINVSMTMIKGKVIFKNHQSELL